MENGTAQVAALTTAQLATLTGAELSALDSRQIAALTTAQVASLDTAQIYTYWQMELKPELNAERVLNYQISAGNPGGVGHVWVKQRFVGLNNAFARQSEYGIGHAVGFWMPVPPWPTSQKKPDESGSKPAVGTRSATKGLVTCAAMLVLRHVATNGDGRWIAGLLIGLAFAAFVTNTAFTGKTWCNFICPVGLVERIYTEPNSLPQVSNSQCVRCTACKKHCPDIDQENAYWQDVTSPARRIAMVRREAAVLEADEESLELPPEMRDG